LRSLIFRVSESILRVVEKLVVEVFLSSPPPPFPIPF